MAWTTAWHCQPGLRATWVSSAHMHAHMHTTMLQRLLVMLPRVHTLADVLQYAACRFDCQSRNSCVARFMARRSFMHHMLTLCLPPPLQVSWSSGTRLRLPCRRPWTHQARSGCSTQRMEHSMDQRSTSRVSSDMNLGLAVQPEHVAVSCSHGCAEARMQRHMHCMAAPLSQHLGLVA